MEKVELDIHDCSIAIDAITIAMVTVEAQQQLKAAEPFAAALKAQLVQYDRLREKLSGQALPVLTDVSEAQTQRA